MRSMSLDGYEVFNDEGQGGQRPELGQELVGQTDGEQLTIFIHCRFAI